MIVDFPQDRVGPVQRVLFPEVIDFHPRSRAMVRLMFAPLIMWAVFGMLFAEVFYGNQWTR